MTLRNWRVVKPNQRWVMPSSRIPEVKERGEIGLLPMPEQQALCPQQFHPVDDSGQQQV